jgi:hypothetical protein
MALADGVEEVSHPPLLLLLVVEEDSEGTQVSQERTGSHQVEE